MTAPRPVGTDREEQCPLCRGAGMYTAHTRYRNGGGGNKTVICECPAGQQGLTAIADAALDPALDLTSVIDESVPEDVAAWRYRYSQRIARAVLASDWLAARDEAAHREAVDLVEGLNVEEWADKAEKRGDTTRDLNAVLNSASAALAEHGVSEDVQETQTLAESIHQAVEAVRREVLAEVSQEVRRMADEDETRRCGKLDTWDALIAVDDWLIKRAEATPHADDCCGDTPCPSGHIFISLADPDTSRVEECPGCTCVPHADDTEAGS